MKRILITGAGSYIGTSFEQYLSQWPENYKVDTVDMIDGSWRKTDFSIYDTVFHVAGIAHSDNGKISEEKKKLYYSVNTELTIETAIKAKEAGVGQFIFMSSAIVYGDSAPIGKNKVITKDTPVAPANCYGDSKVQAENGILPLSDSRFKVVVLRPPMIYGKNCKGNFLILQKLAKLTPIFPAVNNNRSMLYVENLAEFVRLMLDNDEQGIFWPQNAQYSNTSEVIKEIAKSNGKNMAVVKGFKWALSILSHFTGLVNKAFGNLTYDKELSQYKNNEYQKYSLSESIERIEKSDLKQHILVVSQYFFPESFRINDICKEWVKKGNKVTVLTGIPNYPQGKFYKGYSWFKKRKEKWEGINIIRIPLIARGNSSIGMVLNYFSFVISGWFWKSFTKLKADKVFIFEVSPMTQALVGVWFAKRRKIPCSIYVQDLWPENVEIVTGIHSKLVLNPIGKMVDYIYKHCETIFATSPSFVEKIRERVFENKEKVKYLPQYAEDFYKPVENSNGVLVPNTKKFKIVFTGNIGRAQGLDILPKTAKLLLDMGKELLFVIVGDGRYKQKLISEIEKLQVEEMFCFIDRQPAENVPGILSCCDSAFVSFMDNELFSNTIPAKLQSYMACGIPVIAAASGETQRIIFEADCGMCSPIGDSEALAKNITVFMERENKESLCKNAIHYYDENFKKEHFFELVNKELNI